MLRPFGALVAALSTLVLLGIAPSDAAVGADASTGTPTSIEVVATPDGPLHVHLDITVTAAEGTPADGNLFVRGPRGEGGAYMSTGGHASVDLGLRSAGEQQIAVDYPGWWPYAASSASVPVTVEAQPTELELTADQDGKGVLALQATLSEWTDNGVVVFEVTGPHAGSLAPITVPLGQWVIPGRLQQPAAVANMAALDVEKLDATGTYHVTATFVPGEDSNYARSSAEITKTLTWTHNYSRVSMKATSPRPGVAKLVVAAVAYFPASASGKLELQDLTTGRTVVVRRVGPYPDLTRKTFRGLAPGKHRFRVTFVPRSGLDLLGDKAWAVVRIAR